MDERHAVLHHAGHLQHTLEGLVRTMLLDDGLEQGSNLLVRLLEDILMVEPDSLLKGELSASLRALADVEQWNELVKREYLLLSTRVPAQQGEEVDDSLREVAILTIATRGLATLGVFPQQGEYGEAQTIAITL